MVYTVELLLLAYRKALKTVLMFAVFLSWQADHALLVLARLLSGTFA